MPHSAAMAKAKRQKPGNPTLPFGSGGALLRNVVENAAIPTFVANPDGDRRLRQPGLCRASRLRAARAARPQPERHHPPRRGAVGARPGARPGGAKDRPLPRRAALSAQERRADLGARLGGGADRRRDRRAEPSDGPGHRYRSAEARRSRARRNRTPLELGARSGRPGRLGTRYSYRNGSSIRACGVSCAVSVPTRRSTSSAGLAEPRPSRRPRTDPCLIAPPGLGRDSLYCLRVSRAPPRRSLHLDPQPRRPGGMVSRRTAGTGHRDRHRHYQPEDCRGAAAVRQYLADDADGDALPTASWWSMRRFEDHLVQSAVCRDVENSARRFATPATICRCWRP